MIKYSVSVLTTQKLRGKPSEVHSRVPFPNPVAFEGEMLYHGALKTYSNTDPVSMKIKDLQSVWWALPSPFNELIKKLFLSHCNHELVMGKCCLNM